MHEFVEQSRLAAGWAYLVVNADGFVVGFGVGFRVLWKKIIQKKTGQDRDVITTLIQQEWYENYVHFVELRGLQPRSVKSYLGWIKQLAAHFNEPDIRALTSTQVMAFLNHLLKERELKASTVNQAVCALRTLYRDYLKKRWKIWSSIKIKREASLPHVLTRDEVALLLRTVRDGRYRAFFTVMYQCGLRLSECCSIRPKDIDGKRCLIRILGKGKKWRHVPITPEYK